MSFCRRIHFEHWLRDKQDDGQSLILEDDSTWDTHPSDRPRTAIWLRGSTIYVEETQRQEYPYILRNRAEGEVALTNFVGEFRAAC